MLCLDPLDYVSLTIYAFSNDINKIYHSAFSEFWKKNHFSWWLIRSIYAFQMYVEK